MENTSKWKKIRLNNGQYKLICQNCEYTTDIYRLQEYKFCANCGSKMINGEWGDWDKRLTKESKESDT